MTRKRKYALATLAGVALWFAVLATLESCDAAHADRVARWCLEADSSAEDKRADQSVWISIHHGSDANGTPLPLAMPERKDHVKAAPTDVCGQGRTLCDDTVAYGPTPVPMVKARAKPTPAFVFTTAKPSRFLSYMETDLDRMSTECMRVIMKSQFYAYTPQWDACYEEAMEVCPKTVWQEWTEAR